MQWKEVIRGDPFEGLRLTTGSSFGGKQSLFPCFFFFSRQPPLWPTYTFRGSLKRVSFVVWCCFSFFPSNILSPNYSPLVRCYTEDFSTRLTFEAPYIVLLKLLFDLLQIKKETTIFRLILEWSHIELHFLEEFGKKRSLSSACIFGTSSDPDMIEPFSTARRARY